MTEVPPRKNKVFGRRHGRPLGALRRATYETLLPTLRVPVDGPLDPFALFAPRPRAIWLEVGFGAGEHLAWQAERNPVIGCIGCEIFQDGVASLLRHVSERGLANIRVHPDDARDVLAVLPPACLDRVFVLHPDPWPKTRHAQRRFVNAANLDALARVMAPGAELRVATDHPVYQQWALERMAERSEFEALARRDADRLERPADWPETRYEAKARKEGRAPLYLRYRRR